jgi:hypothetical protein
VEENSASAPSPRNLTIRPPWRADLARDPLEAVDEPHGLALVFLGQPGVPDNVREPHRGQVVRQRHN